MRSSSSDLTPSTGKMTYLRNCWYAAIWCEALRPGEIAARTLLDEPLVFFRDAGGQAVAMDDICPPRLAPVRLGKLLPGGRINLPDVKPILLEVDAGPVRCQRILDGLIAAGRAAVP